MGQIEMNKLLVVIFLCTAFGAIVIVACQPVCTRQASFVAHLSGITTIIHCSATNDCVSCCEAFGLSRNLPETVGFREANVETCICCSRMC